jgi:hypothetical protein
VRFSRICKTKGSACGGLPGYPLRWETNEFYDPVHEKERKDLAIRVGPAYAPRPSYGKCVEQTGAACTPAVCQTQGPERWMDGRGAHWRGICVAAGCRQAGVPFFYVKRWPWSEAAISADVTTRQYGRASPPRAPGRLASPGAGAGAGGRAARSCCIRHECTQVLACLRHCREMQQSRASAMACMRALDASTARWWPWHASLAR